jgi:hypothetical protein
VWSGKGLPVDLITDRKLDLIPDRPQYLSLSLLLGLLPDLIPETPGVPTPDLLTDFIMYFLRCHITFLSRWEST